MRNSQFLDRCFVAVVFLGLMGLFTAVAFAIAENEPRTIRTSLILQSHR